ncbi:Assimilatory nitrite reductase [NAD(P)H] small subunit [Pseudovibrio axinellae]|uniref:Assimilatory nitrite reductase [NAD(P)H] small subunit n=1 Tax=Pseudovibrio axinellae TaxID=989403 RepID=A0A166BDN1_9HYPH|nr:nitrite reductase small subunit NirD [Pseudovibrio axinellae]KZL22160.1 Assimilatory nitrite reductase [NAD(P)H] small subunit [Pseudovibrio axinellae]SEQ52951.1 assimilatory nitrite reductase (NAD(P)H) small subunit [Pseudovibrio axinellae]
MNANIKTWIEVGCLEDIPRNGARCVKNGEMTIAVFRTARDEVFALEDKCPHKKGPLSQGIVHDNCVTCPLHNWVISLRSGSAQGADEGHTQAFPVKLEGNVVFIDLSFSKTTG